MVTGTILSAQWRNKDLSLIGTYIQLRSWVLRPLDYTGTSAKFSEKEK